MYCIFTGYEHKLVETEKSHTLAYQAPGCDMYLQCITPANAVSAKSRKYIFGQAIKGMKRHKIALKE